MEMNNLQKLVRWIMQTNLINEVDLEYFREVFRKYNIPWVEVYIIPFEPFKDLWWLDDQYVDIYYGSTRFIHSVSQALGVVPGIFSHLNSFRMSELCQQWGREMLNYGGVVMPLEMFLKRGKMEPLETLYFVRPNDDSKCVDGRVWSLKSLTEWYSKLIQIQNEETQSPFHVNAWTTPLFFSYPCGIEKEWRNLIVQGKLVSSSLYRTNGRLTISGKQDDIPSSMIEYVESQCALWTPTDVFVMDVGWSWNKYWIIECGGVNGAGMYAMDYEKFCHSLNEYVLKGV